MIVNVHNDRNYDTRYFDKCQNYYAILKDEKIIEFNNIKDQNDCEYINIKYDQISTLIIYTKDIKDLTDHQNGYKIIYGHFYNDHNEFLYKKVDNGKIVGYKVHRCREAELWHNKLDKLYISNYFGDIKKTIKLLNTQLNKENRESYISPNEITYDVYDNTLDFGSDFGEYMAHSYSCKMLELIPISNTIKIL